MPRSTTTTTALLGPSLVKDALAGTTTAAAHGEARAQRLRASASHEQLIPSSRFAVGGSFAAAPTATNSVAPSSVPSAAKPLPRSRPLTSLPTSKTLPKLPRASNHNGQARLARDPAMDTLAEQDSPQNQQPASRLPGLRKQPSLQWHPQANSSRQRTPSLSKTRNSNGTTASPSRQKSKDEDDSSENTKGAEDLKTRPSLAERTIETLLNLPSTPTVRTRASHSNFFEQRDAQSPRSRPTSRWGDRPGSSLRSGTPSSRPSVSRPGSSAGPGQEFVKSPFKSMPPPFGTLPARGRTVSLGRPDSSDGPARSSANSPFKSLLPTVEKTPARGRTAGSLMRMPSKVRLNESHKPGSAPPSRSLVHAARARTPSPEKPSAIAASPIAPSLLARPDPPRPTGFGIVKKPSKSVANKYASAPSMAARKGSITSQKSSTTASGEETVFSGASTSSSQTAGTGDVSPQFKKSSAALREQIARAKAAKCTVAQQAPVQGQAPLTGTAAASVIPTDSTFDFGLTDDPFNLQRDAGSTSKILQSRVATARTSGRLNIAALSLKEIPSEVLNMYNLDSIGSSGGSWAECVDLTRFVAADNELEMIDASLFPDVDPEQLAMDDDAPVCMFGGLETLDLHGNMLISLPSGLRRLAFLTSLNLVCATFPV